MILYYSKDLNLIRLLKGKIQSKQKDKVEPVVVWLDRIIQGQSWVIWLRKGTWGKSIADSNNQLHSCNNQQRQHQPPSFSSILFSSFSLSRPIRLLLLHLQFTLSLLSLSTLSFPSNLRSEPAIEPNATPRRNLLEGTPNYDLYFLLLRFSCIWSSNAGFVAIRAFSFIDFSSFDRIVRECADVAERSAVSRSVFAMRGDPSWFDCLSLCSSKIRDLFFAFSAKRRLFAFALDERVVVFAYCCCVLVGLNLFQS